MVKLNRHLGHEFIVEDGNGRLYVCYKDDHDKIHSIDPLDDNFMLPPYKIYERNTNYKGTLRANKQEIDIVDCYWPSMCECENPTWDIRAKIQFKDKEGEWYCPSDIDISYLKEIFNITFKINNLNKQINELKVSITKNKEILKELNSYTWHK